MLREIIIQFFGLCQGHVGEEFMAAAELYIVHDQCLLRYVLEWINLPADEQSQLSYKKRESLPLTPALPLPALVLDPLLTPLWFRVPWERECRISQGSQRKSPRLAGTGSSIPQGYCWGCERAYPRLSVPSLPALWCWYDIENRYENNRNSALQQNQANHKTASEYCETPDTLIGKCQPQPTNQPTPCQALVLESPSWNRAPKNGADSNNAGERLHRSVATGQSGPPMAKGWGQASPH